MDCPRAKNPAIGSADGADVVLGGEGADQIYGSAGADDLRGEGGNDTIYDGDGPGESFAANNLRREGNDRIDGGDRNDVVYAFDGSDEVQGGPGDDNIALRQFEGGELVAAVDTVVCGAGDDRAGLGAGDIADMDCELIIMPVTCPAEAPGTCEVDLAIYATTGSTTATLSAKKKKKEISAARPSPARSVRRPPERQGSNTVLYPSCAHRRRRRRPAHASHGHERASRFAPVSPCPGRAGGVPVSRLDCRFRRRSGT